MNSMHPALRAFFGFVGFVVTVGIAFYGLKNAPLVPLYLAACAGMGVLSGVVLAWREALEEQNPHDRRIVILMMVWCSCFMFGLDFWRDLFYSAAQARQFDWPITMQGLAAMCLAMQPVFWMGALLRRFNEDAEKMRVIESAASTRD